MTDYAFTIPLPPVTKKNSQRIVTGKTGKPFLIPSKQYTEYERAALWHIQRPDKPIDYAVTVKCLFYMPTLRKVDLTNLLEAVDDVLVKAGVLADDNNTIIASHDGSRVYYNKDHPRTEIVISPFQSDGKEGRHEH